jgi:hypothetical protein
MTRGTCPLSCYMAQGHVWRSCTTLGVPDHCSVVWVKYIVVGHGSYCKSLKYSQYMIFNISLSDTINHTQWRAYKLSVTDLNLCRESNFFFFQVYRSESDSSFTV